MQNHLELLQPLTVTSQALNANHIVSGMSSSQHVSMDDPSMAPDADFTPNAFNSMVFLLTYVMQINSFMVEYGQRYHL